MEKYTDEVRQEISDKFGLSKGAIDAAEELGICEGNVGESYVGEYLSDILFARNEAEECCFDFQDTTWPKYCIDWARAAKELMYDYSEHNGHYFRDY